MAYNFKKITDVELLDTFPLGANILIEEEGELKRCYTESLGTSCVTVDYSNFVFEESVLLDFGAIMTTNDFSPYPTEVLSLFLIYLISGGNIASSPMIWGALEDDTYFGLMDLYDKGNAIRIRYLALGGLMGDMCYLTGDATKVEIMASEAVPISFDAFSLQHSMSTMIYIGDQEIPMEDKSVMISNRSLVETFIRVLRSAMPAPSAQNEMGGE